MLTLIAIIAILAQFILTLVVFLNNPRRFRNVAFGMLSLALLSWAALNYLNSLPNLRGDLLLMRVIMFFVVLQNTFFVTFASSLLHEKLIVSRRVKLYIGLSILTGIAALSPLLFTKVLQGSHGPYPTAGPGMLLFIVHAFISIFTGFRKLKKAYSAATSKARTQLIYIVSGSIVLWGIVPLTNFILSLTLQTSFFIQFSPLYALVFSSIIAYAIVAQRLFDVRTAVVRSVTYLLIIATMSAVYGVVLFGIVDVALKGSQHEELRQIVSVILITPLALSFQSIKRFFDKLSNRLFYKEVYDFQVVLDKVGKIVVEEIELYKILNHTRGVLTPALKSSFIEFVLFKNNKPYFEAHTYKTIGQSTLALGAEIAEQHTDLVVTDDLGAESALHRRFSAADVALSLRLKTHEQVVGYVIFGPKRSGDVYSTQDKRLLLILANELAIAVQNALRFEEIQSFNLTLQARVEEATRKLRHANERLKAIDETKDDFISMASHQLRTPLTSVKGYLSMVLEGDAGKITPMQREMLGQAFFSSQRMVYLIADLLNVSRLKTGKFIIEPAPVNLAEVVEEEIGQLKETAASRSLALAYDKPKEFPELFLDETKTRQVIMNFVDNAIYYTPAGGHINVKLVNNPSTIELRVEDDGIGVPKSEQPHLFTKFYRAGNARKARPDGTGLGLFMAKKVIIAQGGSITFDSREGRGSTFGFIFSKTKLAVPAKSTEPEPQAAAIR